VWKYYDIKVQIVINSKWRDIMRVVAINGSPKSNGNTFHALRVVADELEKENIEVEIIHIGNKKISGCMACGKCSKTLDEKCSIVSDPVNDVIQKMKFADGIILGSPVHYSAIGGTMKSFLDRVFLVTGVNKSLLAHKVGASVVAVRRSGGLPTFDQLNNYLNYSQMILPTSNYWNVIHGASPGEVLEDEEGIQILRVLGKNMAWLLKIIDFGKDKNPKPLIERKVYTNFIR